MAKGKSIYLTQSEQSDINHALNRAIVYHQDEYEKECDMHKDDRHNIDDRHLDAMWKLRNLLESKFNQ